MRKIKFMPVAAVIIILIMLVSGCSPTNNVDSDEATKDTASARLPTQNEVTDSTSTNTQELIDATVIPSDIVLEECFVCTIPEDEPYVSESGIPFSKEDIYVSDFHLGDLKDDVLSKVGTPQNTSEVIWEATGETRDINDFSFGQLVFVDEKLVSIKITDTTYKGPRDIKVGMYMNEVTPLFANNIEINNEYTTIFYRANYDGDIDSVIPPSAILYKGDTQTLFYSVFTDDSGANEMSLEELGGYIYFEQYNLVCDFDSQGLLLSFTVRVGALAE